MVDRLLLVECEADRAFFEMLCRSQNRGRNKKPPHSIRQWGGVE